MANVARNQGARCEGVPLRVRTYQSGGAVYPGDLVKLDSSGQVVSASASDALVGAAVGYASASGKDIAVADHPDQLFLIYSDGSTPSAQTDLNLNYNFVAASADTSYKISRMVLDHTSGATTATLPLKLLGIESRPDSDLADGNDVCVVAINNHQLKGGTGTVGT